MKAEIVMEIIAPDGSKCIIYRDWKDQKFSGYWVNSYKNEGKIVKEWMESWKK